MQKYDAIFHADTVQTVGHFLDLSKIQVDFITGASHKFHGPKGVGMLYINSRTKIPAYVHGGGQERNMRAGTENIYGIVGFAKALELATDRHETDKQHISDIKHYMKKQLEEHDPNVVFNGDPEGESLYTVLSAGFPMSDRSEMLLFNLDVRNICVSGGSACSSGANQGSHVIQALGKKDQSTVRFSFSKYNTRAEVDVLMQTLKEIL